MCEQCHGYGPGDRKMDAAVSSSSISRTTLDFIHLVLHPNNQGSTSNQSPTPNTALREERKWAREKIQLDGKTPKRAPRQNAFTRLCFEYLINNCTFFININRKLMTSARVINIIDL